MVAHLHANVALQPDEIRVFILTCTGGARLANKVCRNLLCVERRQQCLLQLYPFKI